MGVHVEQFVDQVVVVCMKARCGVPLALLLEVSEVGVFPGICGFWWGFCKKFDQLFVGWFPYHVEQVRCVVCLWFPVDS